MKSCLLLIVTLLFLAGCSSECSQDDAPPLELSTSQSPYHLSRLSSDLSIRRVRWANVTTGTSGACTVEQVDECVFPLGCHTWTRVSADTNLAPGLNAVYTYEKDGDCEWRDDYLVTLD